MNQIIDWVMDHIFPFFIAAMMLLGVVILVLGAFDVARRELKTPEQVIFEQRDNFISTCLASERYSREECIIMAGQQR